jgi:hypothetical protein
MAGLAQKRCGEVSCGRSEVRGDRDVYFGRADVRAREQEENSESQARASSTFTTSPAPRRS